MPLTDFALDKFVAQEMSQLTAPMAKPVGAEFPGIDLWFANFVQNFIFKAQLPPPMQRVVFASMRRTRAAIKAYDEACAALEDFRQTGRRAHAYFTALDKIEYAIGAIYQAYDFGRRVSGENFYTSGYNSIFDRLNRIYNDSRHTDLARLPDNHIHPVWLRNDGIHTASASVTFQELEEALRDFGRMASQMSRLEKDD